MSSEDIKRNIGYKAADFILDGMIVGLGTGSTAHFFIEALIKKCEKGLKIKAVSTSLQSYRLAEKGKIPLVDINTITKIDITVDGADEIDDKKRMIKGAGGALLREKIIASMTSEMIVIVDESKIVKNLGKKKLPVEVIPFANLVTEHHLLQQGYKGVWRKNEDNSLYVTDNGNYIFDIRFDNERQKPEADEALLKSIPGIVETGLFLHHAKKVIIGFADGKIVIED